MWPGRLASPPSHRHVCKLHLMIYQLVSFTLFEGFICHSSSYSFFCLLFISLHSLNTIQKSVGIKFYGVSMTKIVKYISSLLFRVPPLDLWLVSSLVVSAFSEPFLNCMDITEMLRPVSENLFFLLVQMNIDSSCWWSLNLLSSISQEDPISQEEVICPQMVSFQPQLQLTITFSLELLRRIFDVGTQKHGFHLHPCHFRDKSSLAGCLTSLEFDSCI